MFEGDQRPPGEQRTGRKPFLFQEELSGQIEDLGRLGQNPPLRLWDAMKSIEEWEKAGGDVASQDTVWRIKNAFYALAFRQMDIYEGKLRPLSASSPEDFWYKKLKQEQAERGEDTPWIELTPAQGQDLHYVLDLAGVPFTGEVDANGTMRISLAPLEQVAKEVAGLKFASRRELQKGYMPPPSNPAGQVIDLEEERNKRKPEE